MNYLFIYYYFSLTQSQSQEPKPEAGAETSIYQLRSKVLAPCGTGSTTLVVS
jgi:hypothetical protein